MESDAIKNKRPTWISTIGILGIIFSIIGLFAGVEDLFTPQALNKQKEFLEKYEIKTHDSNEKNKKQAINKKLKNDVTDIFNTFNEMMEKPTWYEKWMIYTGIMKILLNLFLLYISINILSLNSSAVLMFYIFFTLNILFRITIFEVSINQDSVIFFQDRISSLFHIILNLALLIIFLKGNKDIFKKRFI
ncbi:hypothetical protein [Leptospira jelokensis]|uniref:hypothetical protein n=1 Tax=Leptospira jelokensis TaxID=2484931 RepID=UPI001091168E|nr:hypothetical protein [Leptospira jelokensis]TGM06020.1 hypothetical protein EHQ79_02385 [Leptospira jelokensis]